MSVNGHTDMQVNKYFYFKHSSGLFGLFLFQNIFFIYIWFISFLNQLTSTL